MMRFSHVYRPDDVFWQPCEQLMRRHILLLFVNLFSANRVILALVAAFLPSANVSKAELCPCNTSPCNDSDEGSSWIFLPSYYSHDPETGERVTQYAPLPKVYRTVDPTYRESGFHYTEQFLRGTGSSFDALHLVQTWGQGDQIRPYGEWLFPYRAGATPYGPWGNPQGPWTLPFDSWQNPYGLGRLPNPPWPIFPNNFGGGSPVPYANPYSPAGSPVPYGNSYSPNGPGMGMENGTGPMPYGTGPNLPGGNMGNFGHGKGN
jgi:hypothetical protein